VASWTCDGVPKDGQKYPNQNPQGRHEPYENFGTDCVMCRLPKEAIVGGMKSGAVPVLKIAGGLLALATLGGGYMLFSKTQSSCPQGQQKINDICVAVNPAPSPTSPSNSPSTSSSQPPTVSPATVVSLYPTFSAVPNVPELTLRYGGSTSFAPLRSPAIVAKIQQSHPKFVLAYTEPTPPEKPGSGSGIRMLIDGQLSVAQSSRPLKDEEFAKAKDRGFALEQVPVAIDGIAIYINPQISTASLTVAQLKDIFTGKITNWKEVGGADVPVIPVSRDPKDGGTPEYFAEKVMAKESFAKTAQPYARDTTDSLRKVSSTPGAIGYATASEVCNQAKVKTLPMAKATGQSPVAACNGQQVNKVDFAKDAYPITRRLFVIIRRDGKLDEQAGVAYANLLLSDEGQQLFEQAGLVPLRVR
jgi:phosphate transport system substrate-binding protein